MLAGLEKTAGILVTLVKDGPAAAWEQIKSELSELKDQLISQITQMVSVEVVKAAVMKLVSMINPAGAVVQAIIAIYNTVSFFIEKIRQISAVVASFIDSIAAIASGQVDAAAAKVEQTLANTLTLVISFLAKFAGLGGIPNKIVGIIKKIRQPIDRGLDKIVAWLGKMLSGKSTTSKSDVNNNEETAQSKQVKARVKAAMTGKKVGDAKEEEQLITSIYNQYRPEGLKSIRFVNAKGGLDVIVSASAAEKVASISGPELPKITFFGDRMKPFAGSTNILVSYDLDGKSFGASISNKKGEGHAETRLKNQFFPRLIARIRATRSKLRTPAGQPVPVTLDINRTPCDGCAASNLIPIANAYAGEIRLIVNAVTITRADWRSHEQTSVDSVVAMIDAGIQVNASKVWSAIEAKMKEFPQFEFDGKAYDKAEISTFKAEASGVQQLIDDAMAKIAQRKLKSTQRGS